MEEKKRRDLESQREQAERNVRTKSSLTSLVIPFTNFHFPSYFETLLSPKCRDLCPLQSSKMPNYDQPRFIILSWSSQTCSEGRGDAGWEDQEMGIWKGRQSTSIALHFTTCNVIPYPYTTISSGYCEILFLKTFLSIGFYDKGFWKIRSKFM